MAAPVTDPAVLKIQAGGRFLSELRAALDARPEARRFLIGAASAPDAMLSMAEPIVVAAQPVSDTCKEVREGLVLRTVPRENLVILTGPWLVSRQALTEALDRTGIAGAHDPLQLFGSSRL
ncbi:MAG TPA: hypothetical protein VLS53_05705, partial [Candidatus Dormibacteraeota bacterium]|nr:hypothetical protein [Candidatus Dormibacteraeota bacterium]